MYLNNSEIPLHVIGENENALRLTLQIAVAPDPIDLESFTILMVYKFLSKSWSRILLQPWGAGDSSSPKAWSDYPSRQVLL